MARADCPVCHGDGWKVLPVGQQPSGEAKLIVTSEDRPGAASGEPGTSYRFAVLCDCTSTDRCERALDRARIPQRYRHCDFESFEADLQYDHGPEKDLASWNRSLEQAKLVVEAFARDFPVGTEHGLLLMGPCGVGKTHLAVAALQTIVLRGHSGLSYDYRELLKEIQASYNPEHPTTEMGVLEPVLTVEVLLLDDLGSSKPSLWALETVGHILNTRYNENRVTLLTTNYLDSDTLPQKTASSPLGAATRTAVEDTLGERVGMRIRSRLYEMCRTIEIVAPDYRKEIRQARRFRA
jgi:DNA replication protein DnaC